MLLLDGLEAMLDANNKQLETCYKMLSINKWDFSSRLLRDCLLDERVELLQSYSDAYDKENA